MKLPLTPGKGADGERFARRYLRNQGLTVLDTNYRTRQGEIDIVADHGGTLVFVEVRLRSDRRFGAGAETIDQRKQQRLIRAAEHYLLARNGASPPPCRFDVLALSPSLEKGRKYRVEWLQDAFRLD